LPRADPEDRYAELVRTMLRLPGVTGASGEAKGFGSSGQLKVNNRIFAMLVRGSLVLKLPRATVDDLVANGEGRRFDPRRNGRLMKEWLVLSPNANADWGSLTRDALTYVRGR
jgi:hypothetical protein